jgi:hypothetical protein
VNSKRIRDVLNRLSLRSPAAINARLKYLARRKRKRVTPIYDPSDLIW